MVSTKISKPNVHFFYEYDDLLRLTTMYANFGSIEVEPLRFEYNGTNAKLNKISKFSMNSDGSIFGDFVSFSGLKIDILSSHPKLHIPPIGPFKNTSSP